MGPKSDIEDRAKLAIAKHFDNNGNADTSDLVLLGDIINEKVGETISHGWPNIPKVMQNNWKGVEVSCGLFSKKCYNPSIH